MKPLKRAGQPLPAMRDFEKIGYDAWVELWCENGYSPSASQCGARYMPDGPNRSAYVKGWVRAKNENVTPVTSEKDEK